MTLPDLLLKYNVTLENTDQEIFDAFVATENSLRPEFDRRRLTAPTEAKRLYWAQRASGLTTKGGQHRLRTLLNAARIATAARVAAKQTANILAEDISQEQNSDHSADE